MATTKAGESAACRRQLGVHRQGWSRQELTHFHRVFEALWDAGLSLETDSGVTDEGEPWFVFCELTSGDVVAHFARISGKCTVYAPFLNGTLTGCAFPDLVERFLDRCPGKRATSSSNSSPSAA